MKVEIYIGLNSKLGINTVWKNIEQLCQIPNNNKKISVAACRRGWENGLLFTKRLRIMNKNIGY